jgi:hypothetical protein
MAAVADDISRSSIARSAAISPGHPRTTSDATNTARAAVHNVQPASRVRRAVRAHSTSEDTARHQSQVDGRGVGQGVHGYPVHRPWR